MIVSKYNIPRLYSKTIIVISLSMLIVVLSTFLSKELFKSYSAQYTEITTKVTVGNSPPTFTVAPAESPATYNSCAGAAVSGTTITFSGTGTDPNGSTHSYYFIVCSTNSVTPGASGAAPSCGGTKFCDSGSTAIASGTQASCTYNSGGTSTWSTAWFAFVCDNYSSGSLCSAANQGSGDSGSPLFVNHPPAFSASTVSSPVNPGGTITWGSTASDSDTSATVELLVCKTASMSSGTCTGGNWCASSAQTSDPTCSYVATPPYADGSYSAYTYIVDQCDLASTGAAQGASKPFTINNVAPSVSSVTLNGGSTILLSESTTTAVSMTASVSDTNGCRNQGNTADEVSNVKGYLYRSGVTYSSCDTAGEGNNNSCYPEVSCSAGTCTSGVTTYTCSASLQYYADPTQDHADGPVPYTSENWKNTIKATDDNSAVGSTEIATGVELAAIVGGNTTPTLLDYGSLVVGGTVDPLSKQLTTTVTGNTGINANVKAMSANMCTNYPTCTGGTPIPIGNQKYSLTSSTSWASGTAVTTSDVLVNLLIPKQINSTVPSKVTYWGISIPSNTLPGVYNGLIRLTYKMSPSANW